MNDYFVIWKCLELEWRAIGSAYYDRMFGARLRGAKYLRELAASVVR